MTSNKPYLIRALYEWLVDNNATPHILVDSTNSEVMIPPGIDKDGQVVLNIAARAVQGLNIQNEYVKFSARFNGNSHDVHIPIQAVMAIYSLEDGEGMMFAEEPSPLPSDQTLVDGVSDQSDKPSHNKKRKGKPGLKIVS